MATTGIAATIGRPRRAEYTPQDFANFREAGTLNISPKFQRRAVWGVPHRSYFIDTLIRGLPVPPIYLREVQTEDFRRVVREVIDGQQRIHAVLDYLDGKYAISRSLPAQWAGRRFPDLEEEHQHQISNFHFACEVFHGISDAAVLDIFSRLNTYSVQLNRQELRNGRWFGHFKRSCYELAYEHLEFWRNHRIFTEQGIARMLEAELTSELVILAIAGVQDKKSSIDHFYAEYDEAFPDRAGVERRFRATMDGINDSVGDVLAYTNFRRPPLFYSLFGAIHHRLFRVEGIPRKTATSPLNASARSRVVDVVQTLSGHLDALREDEPVPSKYQNFLIAASRQTDNLQPRMIRLLTVYDEANL